ncbi:Retrovirus-related Pol polyprotein from transposon TNT 1-94 [Dendrobium catenatum]|uniref:Retrovirus-related Pol polyprotein from transposon TNT 1-94 n=1 Tax=Dendrobium catenatum TaxID=906689 RepID=A0A2I0WJA6_9ASPA|nr:Retrovirus-related Pol polyprotein from transposon TNT 1-94 [Dendrobium catenatum]
MTNTADNLQQSTTYQGNNGVFIGDGRNIPIAHSGTGILPTPNRKLHLSNLLHVPTISHNLLSISNLVKDNHISITFDHTGFVFKDLTTNQELLRGPCNAGLYKISSNAATKQSNSAFQASKNPIFRWHDRLGHPHLRTLHKIAQTNPSLHIPKLSSFSCNTCIQCKCHKLPFELAKSRAKSPLELVHTDVWGPAPIISTQGYKFFVIFIDDCSRYTWLFPIIHKSDVFGIFKNFITLIENQTKYKIKALRSDGGKEFINQQMLSLIQSKGIQLQSSCPYTPEQNGVSERKNRHIMETTRSLIHKASVSAEYWPEACTTAAYLINRMPSSNTSNKSPLQLMFNILPDYAHLRTFGCECFPLLPKHSRTKLQPKSSSFVFMGYSDIHKGYKCFNRDTNRTFISRHVIFIEDSFLFYQTTVPPQTLPHDMPPALLLPTSKASDITASCHKNSTPHSNHSNDTPTTIAVSTSLNQPEGTPPNMNQEPPPQPSRHPMVTRLQTGSLKQPHHLNLLATNSPATDSDPTSFSEANKHREWRQAMAEEFVALQKQGTWCLIPPPPNASILGCKWTFRKKFNADGSVARFKARLVAQGNRQEYGIDYGETFSPVAKLPTIRILFTVAITKGWTVQQLDVSNAFLHGQLTDTVYMAQPRGFIGSNHPTHVCWLRKSIYGLKQAPRQWYTTFTNFLLTIGFTHSQADPSLLTYQQGPDHIFLLVYVDDILVTGNNQEIIHKVLSQLHSKFNMKNLGPAHHFLGIKIQTKAR